MAPLAVLLVLTSAVAHACWNLLAKSSDGSKEFTFCCVLGAVLVSIPLAAVLAFFGGTAPLSALVFPLVSGMIQVAYFISLAHAYRSGDLSLVYPLARGSGPLLASIGAVLILGERPSFIAWLGIAAILLGVLCLTGDPRALRSSGVSKSVGYALLTGAIIAIYSIWDKFAVSTVGLPPVMYFAMLTTTCAAGLVPWVFHGEKNMTSRLLQHWRLGLLAGSLMAFAYILVLTALVISPVTYVAPMRELGILLGAVLGHRLLSEGNTSQRLVGATIMVIGVITLALG